MNQSKLYVPNPQMWIDYFKNNKPQVGRGFAIPHKSKMGSNGMTISTVSPSEQTVNQAKSELKRDGLNTSEMSTLVHKLSKPSEVTHRVNSARKKQFRNRSKQTKPKKGQKSTRKNKQTENKPVKTIKNQEKV